MYWDFGQLPHSTWKELLWFVFTFRLLSCCMRTNHKLGRFRVLVRPICSHATDDKVGLYICQWKSIFVSRLKEKCYLFRWIKYVFHIVQAATNLICITEMFWFFTACFFRTFWSYSWTVFSLFLLWNHTFIKVINKHILFLQEPRGSYNLKRCKKATQDNNKQHHMPHDF